MKKISYAAFENSIQNCCPGAHIERRDGKDVGVVPRWDFDHDVGSEHLYELIEDSEQPKFKPGDVLRHTQTGTEFTIVDPMAAMMSLRKGAEAKPSEPYGANTVGYPGVVFGKPLAKPLDSDGSD